MKAGAGRPSEYDEPVHFTAYLERNVLEQFKKITLREGKSMSKLLQEYMKRYINEHGDGNNQYKLTKWYQETDFKVTPAFLESHDKWEKYIGECDSSKELARIQGQASDISQKAKQKYMQVIKREMFNR